MRVLITGGAGFIGCHLCRYFIKKGHEVICVDNLSTGLKQNISDLIPASRFTFIKHDVTKPLKIKGRIDWVLHFASPASPEDYMRLKLETLKVGSVGTLNMLELARKSGAKFFLASTSQVYGDPEVHPQNESYYGNVNPVGLRSVYDEAKRFAEALTCAYSKQNGISVRIARIFNTYGAYMRLDDGRALPHFVVQALKGEDLTVYGDGSQTRSYCYIRDMVEGIVRLMKVEYCQPINLGNLEEVSILQLAKEVIRACKSKSGIKFLPLPPDDPAKRRPDISCAKKILKWRPKVSRKQGLKELVNHVKKQLRISVH